MWWHVESAVEVWLLWPVVTAVEVWLLWLVVSVVEAWLFHVSHVFDEMPQRETIRWFFKNLNRVFFVCEEEEERGVVFLFKRM